MKFHGRDMSAVETILRISTLFVLFSYCIGALPFPVKPDEMATVAGKALFYKLPAEMNTHSGYAFKFHTPSWLEFDSSRNLFLGVPSYRDKGSHTIRLDIINDETNKTADTINLLTIEVVEYEEDLNHFKVIRTNSLVQPSKNASQLLVDCPNHAPILVATLVFDLNSTKLSGANRIHLLNKVSSWLNIDVDNLRLMPGKGEKTAFNFKEVVILTAGPGWVKDRQERGVSVSWKIGCGDSITESEKSYVSVGLLKSASQNGAFKNELSSPVVGWHVTYAQVKRRQVVRVRRQAVAQTPVPTSSLVTPTSSIVTQVIGTPVMTRSPTMFTVTPTATRVILSPTQTTGPYPTSVAPSPQSLSTGPINNPPELKIPINTLTAEINEPFTFPIPPDTFSDPEDGLTPRLSLDLFNDRGDEFPNDFWLKLDPTRQLLLGVPKVLGDTKIGLIVTDSVGEKSNLHVFTIRVVPKNVPPRLYNHIDLLQLYIGQPLKFKIPYDTFYDKEDGATPNLTLSMTTVDDQPLDSLSWVEFDAKSQTIYALPYGGIIGKHEFLMIANDSDSKQAVDAFEFHINPLPIKPKHTFGLKLEADYKKFEESAKTRVELCIQIGDYFGDRFNTSYRDIRVMNYRAGSVVLEWSFANIATNTTAAREYENKYVVAGTEKDPVLDFKNHIDRLCSIPNGCSVREVWVKIDEPLSTTDDPNVVGRTDDDDDGTWWEYTIIPAFVVAALILIIGLIIIICIRCRRKSKLDKNEKVVFVQRKKPAVFREEYPMREVYGNQPLITPNEKAPLPPPAYPRSSTPTEDPSERLLNDSSPSYQPPFDSGHEPAGNSRPAVASYRLPPPYVAP